MFRSLKEIRTAIPPRLFERNTWKGLRYAIQDLCVAGLFWYAATYIDPKFGSSAARELLTPSGAELLRWMAWAT